MVMSDKFLTTTISDLYCSQASKQEESRTQAQY